MALLVLVILGLLSPILAHTEIVPQRFTTAPTKIADWPMLPVGDLTQVLSFSDSKLWLLAPPSLFLYDTMTKDSKNMTYLTGHLPTSTIIVTAKSGELLVINSTDLMLLQCSAPAFSCSQSYVVRIPANVGTVAVAYHQNNNLWLGTDKGLFNCNYEFLTQFYQYKDVKTPITAIAIQGHSYLVAGGPIALYISSDFNKFRHEWVGAVIDNPVTSLEFETPTKLWIGNNLCVNTLDLKKYTYGRIGGAQGLPASNITTIRRVDDRMFVGSTTGLGIFDLKDRTWKYLNQDRWIHGSQIVSVTNDKTGVYVSSTQGFSRLVFEEWSLEKKEKHYMDIMFARHFREPGLVAECGLKDYADLKSWFIMDSDNNGGWTTYLVNSLAYKYAITKDEHVRQQAWKVFEGLEFLNKVTGLPGFFARSALKRGAKPVSGTPWYNSTVYPEWQWKGNTSSDEVIEHLNAYAVFHDLVAQTPQEKSRVVDLYDTVIGYILENGYYWISNLGVPTRWGCWAPKAMNEDPSWYSERAINSLEILGHLLNGYRLTKKEKYYTALVELIHDHGYAINLINTKESAILDIDHSDDELSVFAYYHMWWGLDQYPDLTDPLLTSLERTFNFIRDENSVFNVVYLVLTNQVKSSPAVVGGLIQTLQNWPLEQIDYPMLNSIRNDLKLNPEPAIRQVLSPIEDSTLLPYNELPYLRWNGDPFTLDGGSGMLEYDPGAWLIQYWMMKYHNFTMPK